MKRRTACFIFIIIVAVGLLLQHRLFSVGYSPTSTGLVHPKVTGVDCVDLLRRTEIRRSITITKTAAREPFFICHFDPKVDSVVSAMIQSTGLWDVHVLSALEETIGDKCNENNMLTLDVGTNLGFFTNAMLALGCRVRGFEMQPSALSLVQTSACLNKFTHRLELTLGAVSDKAERLKMIDASSGNLGGVFILNKNDTSPAFVEVQSQRLDVLLRDVDESILVMKIDIEGHEPAALKGASRLFEKRMVQNIVLEVSPKVTGIDDAVDMLRRLWQYGFTRVYELHYTPPQQYGEKVKTRPLVFDTDSSARDFVEKLHEVGDIRGERFTDLLLSLES